MDKSWKDNFANPTTHLENAYLAQAKVTIKGYKELTVIHEQYGQQLQCQWFQLYDGFTMWMFCHQDGKWTLSQCGTQVDISIPAADIHWSY